MKLVSIKGIGSSYDKRLRKVGINRAEDLQHINPSIIARKTGISLKRVKKWQKQALNIAFLSDIEGIGPVAEKKLNKAGISDYHKLQKVDSGKLANRTGIERKKIERWQNEAHQLEGGGVLVKARVANESKVSLKKDSLWGRFKEWLKT